jgi:hypothetical protein
MAMNLIPLKRHISWPGLNNSTPERQVIILKFWREREKKIVLSLQMFMTPLVQIIQCFSVNSSLSTAQAVEYLGSIPGFFTIDLWWKRWQRRRFFFT